MKLRHAAALALVGWGIDVFLQWSVRESQNFSHEGKGFTKACSRLKPTEGVYYADILDEGDYVVALVYARSNCNFRCAVIIGHRVGQKLIDLGFFVRCLRHHLF